MRFLAVLCFGSLCCASDRCAVLRIAVLGDVMLDNRVLRLGFAFALVLARARSAVSSDPCSGGLTSSWLWALQCLRSAPSSRPRSRCLRRRSAAAAIFAESQELKSFAVSVQQRRPAFVYDACKRRPR